jgi:hypothetical protein
VNVLLARITQDLQPIPCCQCAFIALSILLGTCKAIAPPVLLPLQMSADSPHPGCVVCNSQPVHEQQYGLSRWTAGGSCRWAWWCGRWQMMLLVSQCR